MTTAAFDKTSCAEETSFRDVKVFATDAIEDGVRAARRAFKTAERGVQTAVGLRDEAAVRVKREPFKAVGVAFGVGLLMGAVAGWAGRRPRSTS